MARALLILGTKSPIRVLCARELQNSIAESVHKVLSDQISKLGLDSFYHIEKAKIYGANGTEFAFEGIKNNTNKIKSYEGIDYCWVEEAIKVSRASWSILIPTIRKTGSEIWMTFNPELEEDYTYQRWAVDASLVDVPGQPGIKESDQVISVRMSYQDNPWFKDTTMPAEMEADKKKDYDHYLNIWEGFCVHNLEGAVYARELRKATEDQRICTVPYDPEIPVDTFWDLGRAMNTSIWFAQRVAMQYRVLAYYENNDSQIPMDDESGGINHFLKECQKRGYVYGTMHLPHDAKAKRLGTKRSVEEVIRQAGYRVSIVPKLSLTDGINAARIIFPQCWFDETECADGLNALRHYRYRVVDGHLSSEPIHDWASDGADAFRYLGVSIKKSKSEARTGLMQRLMAGAKPGNEAAKEFARNKNSSGLGWLG